jgi:hypothetical protein
MGATGLPGLASRPRPPLTPPPWLPQSPGAAFILFVAGKRRKGERVRFIENGRPAHWANQNHVAGSQFQILLSSSSVGESSPPPQFRRLESEIKNWGGRDFKDRNEGKEAPLPPRPRTEMKEKRPPCPHAT